jgi:hypothetical protein
VVFEFAQELIGMPEILDFSRNRCTSVEQLDEQTLRSVCRLQDTLMEAVVEIRLQLPDLEITDVRGKVIRGPRRENAPPTDLLQKVIGVRVGPGMSKIIKGLLGEFSQLDQLVYMLEECCHGVILAFTKDVLLQSPSEEADSKEFYAKMVRDNPRLYNRCAAFAPGSSLVEGIEPPK